MKLKFSWRKLLLLAFGMSMFSSLVYEVVWTRQLSLVFGTTVYALSAVLTSFMAGLAVGSYFIGKIADRTRKLFSIFAKFEFILAIYAIMLLFLFKLIQYPYFFLFDLLENSFLLNISIFVMTFIALIIPTAIIGATFPLMSRIYTKEIGKDISDIYSADTIFASGGALLAGFVFLPYLGLIQTTILGCIINLAIGYLFYMKAK